MNNFECDLQVLGLDRAATKTEIKEAYRRLAKQWHPDLYLDRPQLLAEAEQKFRQINQAYERLQGYTPGDTTTNRNSATSGSVVNTKNAPEINYQRGVEFAETEDYHAAIAEFSQAIKLDPNYLKAYQYRGFILSKLGYELRAKADFERVENLKLSFNTNHNKVRYRTSSASRKTNKLHKHRQRFLSIIKKFWLFFALMSIAFILIVSI